MNLFIVLSSWPMQGDVSNCFVRDIWNRWTWNCGFVVWNLSFLGKFFFFFPPPEYLNNRSFYNDSETISVILNLNIFNTFWITVSCYIGVPNIHPNSIIYCQKFSFILLCCHSYILIFRSSKIWVFWDVMLCHGKCNYKNFKDYSAFIFTVLTLKMKSLWPFETLVTSCPVTQHHAQKTCQQHHCANLKSHFRSLFHSEGSIFQSVWPQLESEILKAKFIFWKLRNFELNVAYMNREGRIWIKILFWVIWLLADISKICTRQIKFRRQDLIS